MTAEQRAFVELEIRSDDDESEDFLFTSPFSKSSSRSTLPFVRATSAGSDETVSKRHVHFAGASLIAGSERTKQLAIPRFSKPRQKPTSASSKESQKAKPTRPKTKRVRSPLINDTPAIIAVHPHIPAVIHTPGATRRSGLPTILDKGDSKNAKTHRLLSLRQERDRPAATARIKPEPVCINCWVSMDEIPLICQASLITFDDLYLENSSLSSLRSRSVQ
eukprot:1823898-Rhodomonas_salina.2